MPSDEAKRALSYEKLLHMRLSVSSDSESASAVGPPSVTPSVTPTVTSAATGITPSPSASSALSANLQAAVQVESGAQHSEKHDFTLGSSTWPQMCT